MVPIIISEFKLWSTKYRRKSMSVLTICVLLFGSVSGVNPVFLMIGVALALFWLGIKTGIQSARARGSEMDVEFWFQKTHLSPIQIIAGKVFVTAIIVLYHDFLLLPITYLMFALWGIDGWLIFEINLLIMVFTLLISTVMLIFRSAVWMGIIILCTWTIITFKITAVQFMNPFYQMWMITVNGAHIHLWLGITENLGLLLLVLGIQFLLFKREVIGSECRRSL